MHDPAAESSVSGAPGEESRFVARRPGAALVRVTSGAAGGAAPLASAETAGNAVRREGDFSEFGELAAIVADPSVTDVFVNGVSGLWVDRGSGLVRLPPLSGAEPQLRQLAVQLIAAGGRHIDEASPCVDVRLHDGIRVHAVLPPISPAGTLLSIRLPAASRLSVLQLEAAGFFDAVPLASVAPLVTQRRNILITGASGSGKTTLLAALLSTVPDTDRIVAIEDVAELRVDHPHFVSLEARQANLEGAGAVGLERLVREALRMRPDRLVLGECRGAEIRELLSALNTGHDGGAGTLHANSLADVPARLEALGALAGLTPGATARQTVSAIGVVLHLERRGDVRRLVRMGRFALDARDRLRIEPIEPPLSWPLPESGSVPAQSRKARHR
jgi:pilus assembly protein CpaF